MKNPKHGSDKMVLNFGTWLVDRVNVFFRLRRYIKMVSQRWTILAGCAIVGGLGGTWLALRTPNIYSASSKIGIAPKIQTAYNSQAQYLEELNNFYDSQIQYMTSYRVTSKVDEKLHDTRPSAPDFFLSARALKGAGCFSMVVESTDLDFARRYAQTWAREFITFKNELRENAIGKSAASTRDEIGRYEKSLDRARAALLDFQRTNNIGSVKETGDAAQQRLDRLEADYQDVKTLRQRLEVKTPEEIASGAQLDTERSLRDKEPETKPKPATADSSDPLARFESASKYSELRLQLKTQQSEWDRLTPTLKPRHPYMQKLQQEIQHLNLLVQHQLDLIEEKRLARIRSLRADEESYRPLIDELRQQVLASRNVQYAFERLREEESNVKAVLGNLRKAEESLNSTTSDEGPFNIIEEGVSSPVPVRPDRRKTILAGLILGLGLGLGFIYLLGRLDDRLELAEDIENELEEPILGQVPRLELRKINRNRPLVTELDQHHLFAESLRGVRSAVMFCGSGEQRKQVLLVTSAVPGDGKTTFTTNFAATLAIAGHSVLLVDADLRRGDTHSFFDHPRDPGLAEVLQGELHWTDVARPTPVKGLQVIHTGRLPTNPGELLISPITRQFIEEARKAFDYVVVDCPPLTGIDDAFSVVGLVDGLLFIVRSGQTSMRFAKNALHALRQRGVSILGIVLNAISRDNPHYYYRNYYHDYYSADEQPTAPAAANSIASMAKMAAPKGRALGTGSDMNSQPAQQIIAIEQFQRPEPDDQDRRSGKG